MLSWRKPRLTLLTWFELLAARLMEFEGNVVSIKNNKVKVTLPSLGIMMTADVQKSNVELLDYSYKFRNMVS